MPKVRILNFTISIDGYGAGPNQAVDTPLGVGGEELHNWMVKTATFRKLYGGEGGTEGVDDDFTARGLSNIGAWILGRNMFTLSRGAWTDDGWKGWWGKTHPITLQSSYSLIIPEPPSPWKAERLSILLLKAFIWHWNAPAKQLVKRMFASSAGSM